MKKVLAYGAIVASALMIPFGGPVWPDSLSQEQSAMSVVPPVPPVDDSFIILVKGDPGDRW